MKHTAWLALLAAALIVSPAYAETPPPVGPMPKTCETSDATVAAASPLPNVAAALKDRKKIRILAIGSTSASMRGPVAGGHYAVVERLLESTFKGVDVEIVHRGVSGELASDAAERIRTEAALASADLVLWQLGTADAMAQIPVADFEAAVTETITWLKEHNIDVILVGLRYTPSMARDQEYQAIRAAIKNVAKAQNVLRIGRYEAEEMLERIRREQGTPLSSTETTEADNICTAEYLARAIAAGLFLKDSSNTSPKR